MERHELHNKIIQQLRFHRISGLDEEQCADNILSIVEKDWTQGCSCYEGDKTGETWCCNKCGKPTKKTTTLPSDEVEFALKLNKYIHDQCIDGTPHDIGWNVMKMFSTRIAEMERELQEAKSLVRSITEFADGMKVLDGEALRVLKNTARRVLSDKPTQLPRK